MPAGVYPRTKKHREKISNSLKGKKGNLHSKKTKMKISKKLKGIPLKKRGHKSDCQCPFCKNKRGELSGKNHHNYKHGGSKSKLYTCWKGMKARCYNLKISNYFRYGGRGIKVCNKWKNDFRVFRAWALANGYKENLTIDRIDNNGNYEPSNCQWITKEENSRKDKINKKKDP